MLIIFLRFQTNVLGHILQIHPTYFKLECISIAHRSSQIRALRQSSDNFNEVCFVLSVMNKRALLAFDCKMSWYSSIDSLTHNWKQAFSRLQTDVRIVDNKMAAGTDHYLEVIKPCTSMSTAEQLLCQLARAVYETHCQLVTIQPPINIKTR